MKRRIITEKKTNLGRRRSDKANFRAMNNYQTIEKIPNDNLYKNDNFYSMDKNFEFPPNEEESYNLFFYYYYQIKGIKIILIIVYLRFCFLRINTLGDLFSFKFFNLKNIFHVISAYISFKFAKEIHLKQVIYNLFLYYLFFINQNINIYYMKDKLTSNFDYYTQISAEFLFNLLFLFFMNIKFRYNISFPLVFFLAILPSTKDLVKRFIFMIIVPFFSLILYIIMKKNIREIWALFDSFKRSYYNLSEGILESNPNPIFIISKDKNILYKNNTASKLIDEILLEGQNTHRKKFKGKDDRYNTMNFLDIIHPNFKELFKKLINDVMEDDKVSSFNFPLCKISDKEKTNLNISNAYDIFDKNNYLYFFWFKIVICKTEWKSKTSYYMSFFPCEDVLLNEIFYQFTKRFSEKIEKVISNSDIICDALINRKDENEEKEESQSHSSSMKSSDVDDEEGEKDEKRDGKFTLKKNIYKLLRDNVNNIELNNTILFFFKNQVEFLYDYSLTMQIYFNMLYKHRNFKHCMENTKTNLKKKIKLNEFKAYYSEYFYDFAKEHKYKIEFKDEEKNTFNIYIEENYLRIIMFNIITFMICYLDDKEEPTKENKKEIVIKIIHEIKDDTPITPGSVEANDEPYDKTPKGFSDSDKSLKKGEVSFIFESFSTKKDLNKIKSIIDQKNKYGYHLKTEILKLNFLDIGILAVNYLLENYYKTKLKMTNKEGEQSIQFTLVCDLELMTGSTFSRGPYNQTNITPESNSFLASPLIRSKRKINAPKNFYNYNKDYNQKVLNIFYGIEKSPVMYSRHKRAGPSLSKFNEIINNRRGSRHLSQNLNDFIVEQKKYKEREREREREKEKEKEYNNYNNIGMRGKIIHINNEDKPINNQFSFKQMNFTVDSKNNSSQSDKAEKEEPSKEDEKGINLEIYEEKEEEDKNARNKVLIFESQNNKDFISFLNNENKGEYILKVAKDVNEEQKEIKNKKGKVKARYKIILVNMGNSKEIKFAEKICENKGECLIYGYHFGTHTCSREKNSVKYDKRFDLSFSSEGIVYALKQVFINNNSII